jgi:hypothetical protein
MNRLKNKKAIVISGTSGIGKGRWVQSLSCQRDGRTGYDPKYVVNH